MFYINGLAVCAAFAAVFAFSGTTASSQTIIESVEVHSDAKLRVNLAGRQRMLSQRLSEAVCLLHLGVDTTEQSQILLDSRQAFDSVLSGLVSIDKELGLMNHETSSKVLRSAQPVQALWTDFDQAIKTMVDAQNYDADTAKVIFENSESLLFNMNELVSVIEQVHANPAEMMASEGMAINIAGRQRMLTQKMGKELCLAVSGWKPVETRVKLQKTIKMFEASHNALLNGNPMMGMKGAPTEEVRAALAEVEEQWLDIRPMLTAVINGHHATAEDLTFFARESDKLLKNMHAIVGMFEKI